MTVGILVVSHSTAIASGTVELARQMAGFVFGLAPVFLVVHLVRRSGEGPAGIGLAVDRPASDLARGLALFAVVGAWSFLASHIYYPYGVATMVMLALGHTLLLLAATRRPASDAARSRTCAVPVSVSQPPASDSTRGCG